VTHDRSDENKPCGCAMARRTVLKGMAGLSGAALAGPAAAQKAEDMAPQPGDFLVSALGSEPLSPQNIRLAAGPFEGWAMSPEGVARRNNFENSLHLFRYDPAELSADVRAMSADGVVALTVICPHAGCGAIEWQGGRGTIACPCHGSRFSPKQGGALVMGPARRKRSRSASPPVRRRRR
jgi:rieske iron-sulfur protein